MSKNSTVSLTLQLKGQQAQDVINRLQQSQTKNTNELLRTNQHLESVLKQQATHTQLQAQQLRQLTQINQANTRTITQQTTQTQAGLRTNQLLERVLQQQTRQSTLQSQQLRNQNRDYQLQVNMLRQQAAAAERLRRELQGAGRENQHLGRGGNKFAIASGLVGGAMAAKAVATTPLERGRNFSATIFDATASITNGFNGMSKQEAKAQNQQLMTYAKDAVRQGHGTVEGTSEAAGILAASGIYEKVSDLKDPLQAIAKSSFASGANETDMAKLAQQVKQFGVSVDKTQVAFDRMIGSGQAGGFELKDMSQFLPVVLASASRAGYTGEQGLNQVTTHLQLARKYTGTPGEAATNIDDLYGLVNQKHFKDAIAKNIDTEKGDPTKLFGKGKKKKQVFDLTTYLADNQLKGIDTITSVATLMDRQLSKNPQYVALNKKLAIAVKNKNQEEITRIKQAIELVTSGDFGDVFHNKQSLAGISAIISGVKNGDYKDIYNKSWNKEGATADLADIKGDNEFAQAEALQQEKILAQIKIYESINEKLGGFEGWLVGVMRSNEGLTAATIAATGALTVFAGVAGGGLGSGIASGAATTTAGQFVLAGAIGYGIGTVGRDAYMQTETGQKFDSSLTDTLGHDLTETLAFFGNQEAQDALNANTKYDQMIAEQQVHTNSINQGFSMLAQTIINNKPVFPSIPAPQPLGSLAQSISNQSSQQEKRHGAVIPFALK